ncbi:hypothetical protein EVAR_58495_1 [Eumeta japonica]|uniref:Uncharacterized protein n=1 Tax=Eumeta variegata TaxID=151549 RepID=A0A4C1ZGW1_EUMVA|nr:hypothetical protein EVAR_58495_1 [Eumeta japonica]
MMLVKEKSRMMAPHFNRSDAEARPSTMCGVAKPSLSIDLVRWAGAAVPPGARFHYGAGGRVAARNSICGGIPVNHYSDVTALPTDQDNRPLWLR